MLFSEILDQEKAKSFLKQAISREKLPHAYLFTGIPGIGKTSTGKALTTLLNCHEPVDGDGCGQCPACRQIKSGNFPDFLMIRPDGAKIKIDQIRALNRNLSFAPVTGKYRVCIIIQAETMTEEAANSFLKTLEEPPMGNILILNATEPLDLLPTIVSRCQKIPFQPLPMEVMKEWLVKRKSLNEENALLLAKICGGSLGKALEMNEGDFFEKRQACLLKLIQLPGMSKEKALDMALESAGEIRKKQGVAQENDKIPEMDMLSIWELWYRDLILAKAGDATRHIMNVDFSQKLKKMSERITIANLEKSLLAVDQAQRDLKMMRNRKLVMEHLVLQLRGLSKLEHDRAKT